MAEKVTIGNAELWHGDCREVLPVLPHCDLILTDPPYGIKKDGQAKSTGKHGGRRAYEFLDWDSEPPPAWLFGLIFEKSDQQIIWGANYYPQVLKPSMGWLFWDKGQRISQSDGELAFTSRNMALRATTLNRVSIMKDGATHPTQKPVWLMEWCLSLMPDTETVCDPYMGSGSTGVACARAGKHFTGIERERKYFDIACERIEQAQAQGQLLPPDQPEPAQQHSMELSPNT